MLFNALNFLGILIAQTKPTTNQVESGFAYVIAAFIVIWLFIAGYLFWLNRRQEELRREVELLREEEAERLRTSQAGAEYHAETEYTPETGVRGPGMPSNKQEVGG
ncbi:MAG TPA: CcmD family protein [Chloroflexia bacterium]|nr:CcmD family protein [Chloroflexia bacterium]